MIVPARKRAVTNMAYPNHDVTELFEGASSSILGMFSSIIPNRVALDSAAGRQLLLLGFLTGRLSPFSRYSEILAPTMVRKDGKGAQG